MIITGKNDYMKQGMNKENKLIGVLGGLGPWATSRFFEMVLEETAARCDQDYPDLMIINRSTTPDRTSYLLKKSGVSPVKYMAEDAARLEKAGCGAIVIPCNTSHIYYDKIADRVSIQVVNLIKEVAAEGNLCGMRRIGIMCTEGTRVSRLYDVAAERNFMQCVYPSEIGQKYVNSLIYDDVKAGRKPVRKKIIDVFDELLSRGCDGIVLGCTELSVAYRLLALERSYANVLDSLRILARRTVEISGKRLKITGLAGSNTSNKRIS